MPPKLRGRPIVTLLTDFGTSDSYVAEVKGMMLSIEPNLNIIDVSHSIASFNERAAAFLLTQVVRYFPSTAVHVAVVDPRVGTRRKGIIVETVNGFLVGPDTGILYPAAQEVGIRSVFEIDERKFPPRWSETFHGRDVFARIAALLASGKSPNRLGVRTRTMRKMRKFEAKLIRGKIWGEIVHVDKFGNLITDVLPQQMERILNKPQGTIRVAIGRRTMRVPFRRTYGEVSPGQLVLVVGGTGYVELSENRGHAARRLRVKIGDRLVLES